MHPLERAGALVGGITALAKILGRHRSALYQWMEEGRRVPAEFCPLIERLTNGKVLSEELNPSVDWGFYRRTCQRNKSA